MPYWENRKQTRKPKTSFFVIRSFGDSNEQYGSEQIGKSRHKRPESKLLSHSFRNFHFLLLHQINAAHHEDANNRKSKPLEYPIINIDNKNASDSNRIQILPRISTSERSWIFIRNAEGHINSHGKDLFLSKIRFNLILHKVHEIWNFLNGMKSTEVPVTEGNGETDHSDKIKQHHPEQYSKMDMRSSSEREKEEEYDIDRISSFGRREDEEQEFYENKYHGRGTKRVPSVYTPQYMIPKNEIDALRYTKLEDEISLFSWYINDQITLKTLISLATPMPVRNPFSEISEEEVEKQRGSSAMTSNGNDAPKMTNFWDKCDELWKKKAPEREGVEHRRRAKIREMERQSEGTLEFRMNRLPPLMEELSI